MQQVQQNGNSLTRRRKKTHLDRVLLVLRSPINAQSMSLTVAGYFGYFSRTSCTIECIQHFKSLALVTFVRQNSVCVCVLVRKAKIYIDFHEINGNALPFS